ncbi:MAG: phosphoribosyltransferase family protein [Ginsengibacter sp.]
MPSEDLIITADTAAKKMQRMAYEIAEHNIGEKEILLAGIKVNGLIIAAKIKEYLEKIFEGDIEVLEINLDKKDPKKINIPGNYDFNGKVIIIADDVANTGKTLSYAVKPFLDFYPKKIQTLVLVERSHREFPVSPDYVGLTVSTGIDEKIIVETKEKDVTGARLETNVVKK